MKKILSGLLLIAIALSVALPTAFVTAHTEEEPYTVTLWAGQHIDAGTVKIWNDANYLYVLYETTDGWELLETHVYAGTTDPYGIPPGQFPYKHEGLGGVTSDLYEISLSEGIVVYITRDGQLEYTFDAVSVGDTLYIAAHAAVQKFTGYEDTTPVYQTETGWASETPHNPETGWGEGTYDIGYGWGGYFEYVIQGLGEEEGEAEMGARTIGYWKTHPEVWPDGFEFMGESDQSVLLSYFPGMGAESDGMAQWEKVRVQLLAVELNIACFGPGTDYNFDYESTGIYDVVNAAYDFLSEYAETTLSHGDEGWEDYMELGSEIYEALDAFNNMGDEIFEAD